METELKHYVGETIASIEEADTEITLRFASGRVLVIVATLDAPTQEAGPLIDWRDQ